MLVVANLMSIPVAVILPFLGIRMFTAYWNRKRRTGNRPNTNCRVDLPPSYITLDKFRLAPPYSVSVVHDLRAAVSHADTIR